MDVATSSGPPPSHDTLFGGKREDQERRRFEYLQAGRGFDEVNHIYIRSFIVPAASGLNAFKKNPSDENETENEKFTLMISSKAPNTLTETHSPTGRTSACSHPTTIMKEASSSLPTSRILLQTPARNADALAKY